MLFHRTSKKDNRAQDLINQYQNETAKNEKNCRYYFPLLYSALNEDPAPQKIRLISDEAVRLIDGKDPFYVANLMHSYNNEPMNADTETWIPHCSPEGLRALLICGAAHRNGYFREHCLKQLPGKPDVLPFLLFRLNDWVPEIRHTAWTLLQEQFLQTPSCAELIRAIPFVEYVRRGRRVQTDAGFSMDALDAMWMQVLAGDAESVLRAPVSLRKLCYKLFILHPDSRYADQMLYFIRKERDGAQRAALVRAYLQNGDLPVSDTLLTGLMHDRFWRVQLDAYEYRMKRDGVWEGLEKLLGSRHYPIREFAAYYLEKNGFDNLAYCRTHLPETMLALSDLGKKDDAACIRPYLESYPVAALTALVRLDVEDSRELVWEAMHSKNARLAKTAYRLAQTHIHYTYTELRPEIRKETDPVRLWRIIRLLGKNADTELLPLLIRMTRDYVHIRSDIIELIRMICGCRKYHCYAFYAVFVTQQLYDEIIDAFQYAGRYFPDTLKDYIIRMMRVK